jgi:retron-type reverse transcriptase
LRLFEKWIKAEIYDGSRIWTLQKGIPQGSVVSPPLANLFLDELDETLMEFGLILVRYADDFLILCKKPDEAQDAIEITDMVLEDMKLDLNPLKTKIVSFDKGFKFLGAIFLSDGVYLPFPEKRKETPPPKLPPPLTLKRYLELKNKLL